MVLIITFIVTMIVGVPICYVLGLVGAAGLVSMGPTYFSTVAQKLFASANNYMQEYVRDGTEDTLCVR